MDASTYAALINFLDVLLAASVIVPCWQRRKFPGALAMGGMMLAILEWSLFNAFECLDRDYARKILWARFQYIGVTLSPYFYLFFALEYGVRIRHIHRLVRVLLLLPPVVFCLAVFTNSWHHLIWTEISRAPGNLLQYGHGSLYWGGVIVYDYLLFIGATLMMLHAVMTFPGRYWKQTLIILGSIPMPFLASFFYNLGLVPNGVDPTPVGLALTGAGLYLSIVRNRFLDVAPMARHLVFERMREGMLVFDSAGRLVDSNRAMVDMLGCRPEIGASCASLPVPWNSMAALLVGRNERCEIRLDDEVGRIFEVNASALKGPREYINGYFLLIRDVTENRHLEVHLESLALHDALTGLFNRHHLAPAMQRDISRCMRDNAPLAVVMFDLDHFKMVNDMHGHQAGDAVLQSFGRFLLGNVRRGDFACRYGGEEFVLVLPETDLDTAVKRARTWGRQFSRQAVSCGRAELHVTVSGGVSAFPEHGSDPEQLILTADGALYQAKRSGRNRIEMATSVAG